MRYVVFETEKFRDELVHYGLERQYEALKPKFESGERSLEDIEGLKKCRFESNFRLVAWDVTKEILEEQKEPGVLVFLSVLKRGGHEYDQFIEGTDKRGRLELRDRLQKRLTLEERGFIKEAYKEGLKPKIVHKPPLPEEIYHWLELSKWHDKLGELNIGFCESQMWSQEIKNMDNYLSVFHKILVQIADEVLNPEKILSIKTDFSNLFIMKKDDCAVYYSLRTSSQGILIFLVKPVILNNPAVQLNDIPHQLIVLFKDIFDKYDLPMDDILKHSYQAYPVEMVMEFELWSSIEKDEESHPALSTEEENILLSISTPGGISLPIFINGRAGSGKSTLLQYVYCLYASQKLAGINGEILYLTYSEQLCKSAKDLCIRILKNHYNFVGERSGDRFSDNGIEELAKKSFRTFQELLLEYLPVLERDRFVESKRVTFYQFKNEFYPKVAKTPIKCSPETAWHVIRAYIKGRETGFELPPEEYRKIPSKDQTVDIDTYQTVYERVWHQYKTHLEEKRLWDDLDLVNRVLWLMDNDPKVTDSKKYVAIFCDEAQDFTKTELALILRISVFSDYDLSKNTSVNTLPFAFAGDPLQTITPTGFNWERFTSMFYDALKASFLIEEPKQFISEKLLDLEYNYRSHEGIVKFSNLVQFLRYSILEENCKPQKCWREDAVYQHFNGQPSSVPKYFIFTKNLSEYEFEENAKDSVIILPSEEGGLDEFINDDDLLRRMKENKQGEIAFEDAISSKGLEMDKVIVYKFGHHLKNAQDFWEHNKLAEDQIVYFKYYLNRLYVAVTRAKKQLNIVDTVEGYEKFWSMIKEDKLAQRNSYQDWNKQDCFIYLLEGLEAADLIEDKPLNNANKYKEVGILERNPQHIAKAMTIYRQHGKSADEAECTAYRNWFLGNYKTAGQMFLELGSDNARDCFWEGQEWGDLESWYSKKHAFDSHNQRKRNLAQFWISLTKGAKDEVLDKGLIIIREEIPADEDRLLIERYDQAIEAFIKWVSDNIELLNEKESQGLLTFLEENIEMWPIELCININYKIGHYEKVVELAEDYDRLSDKYWESKLQIDHSENEKIKCLLQLKRNHEAIDMYEAMEENRASRDAKIRILGVYEQLGQYSKAAVIYLSLGDPLKAFTITRKNLGQFQPENLKDFLKLLFSAVIQSHNVDKVLREIVSIKDKSILTTILPSLFDVMASESIDIELLNIPHSLVNDFYKHTYQLVMGFTSYAIVSASLTYERIDCKRIDLMNFYEALMRQSNLEPKFLNLIRERWLYVKNKHISTERATNKKQAREEIESKKEAWGIDKIPTSIPSLEDAMKRLGNKKSKVAKKEKEKISTIVLELDDDNNFCFEEYLNGEVVKKKNEYRIKINLATMPSKFLFRVDDKQFRLVLDRPD